MMLKRLLVLSTLSLFLQALLPAQNQGMIGEVKLFAGTFAPRGWAFCQGQSLPISQYNALYSILGVQYGGDGRTTFNLPNLPGVPSANLAHANAISKGGGGTVSFVAKNNTQAPVDMYWIDFDGVPKKYATIGPNEQVKQLSGAKQVWHFRQGGELIYTALLSSLGKQQLSIQEPTNLRYIICLEGIYPARN